MFKIAIHFTNDRLRSSIRIKRKRPGDRNSSEYSQNPTLKNRPPKPKPEVKAQSNGENDWLSKTQTGLGAFDIAQGAKGEIINYAAKLDAAINDLKYVKGLKILSRATFGISPVISGGLMINYYKNGGTDDSVLMKTALDIGMGYVGFLGPIGFGISATYFIIDASGAFQGWGDPFINPKQ